MSPPPMTLPNVIILGAPEGPEGGDPHTQDQHMHDSSAPTEENLGAGNIGAGQPMTSLR